MIRGRPDIICYQMKRRKAKTQAMTSIVTAAKTQDIVARGGHKIPPPSECSSDQPSVSRSTLWGYLLPQEKGGDLQQSDVQSAGYSRRHSLSSSFDISTTATNTAGQSEQEEADLLDFAIEHRSQQLFSRPRRTSGLADVVSYGSLPVVGIRFSYVVCLYTQRLNLASSLGDAPGFREFRELDPPFRRRCSITPKIVTFTRYVFWVIADI
jgi:hypothetical protein